MARKTVESYAAFENIGGTISIVLYYDDGGADTVENVSVSEGKFLIDLLRHEKPVSYDASRKRISTLQQEPVGEGEGGTLTPVFTLENWLNARVYLRNAINWEFPGGIYKNYTEWTAAQKAELEANYRIVLNNSLLDLSEAPPLAYVPHGTETAVTYLSSALAWKYYLGHVAHSLVVEADDRVNWSLADQTEEERKIILDGKAFFLLREDNTYHISRGTFGGVTYGNPSRLFKFLIDNDLIGSSHLSTICNLIGWSRQMVHFTGAHEADNVYDQWQYYGLPPIERVINGTIQTSLPSNGVKHRTGGCHGTVGFFRALLRIINIPVRREAGGGHALHGFPTIDKYLSHGDDPYNGFFRRSTEIPNSELLISQATFNQWFTDASDPGQNVGRRVRELALQYLPLYLLRMHCTDLSAGRNHAESDVAAAFDNNYSVAQLEAQHLWQRMDEKIASSGGCSEIPYY